MSNHDYHDITIWGGGEWYATEYFCETCKKYISYEEWIEAKE